MVGQEAGKALRITSGLAVLLSVVMPATVSAQSVEAPDANLCASFPADPEAIGGSDQALPLPNEWDEFAKSIPGWIAVKTGFGTTHCSATAWMYDAGQFETFGERFIGFEWNGYEAWGYVLIDRSGQGREIDTGAKPVFSPSGNKFAVLHVSEAGWGGFEGFALWNSYGTSLQPFLVNSGPPTHPMLDWRVERWEGEDCLHISAVPYERIDGDWERIREVSRDSYVAGEANGWEIVAGDTCPAYDAP